MEGINVVGVRFRTAGKMYDFASKDIELKVGEWVVVDTDRGPSLAKVADIKFVDKNSYAEGALKSIVRKAAQKDLEVGTKLTHEYATSFIQQKITELKLEMRILKIEIQFGGNKVIVYFTAPGRVDFRELVKQLAGGLKARVELKQVGARDETKIFTGLGICGKEFCCSSWLCEFVPISIKMAKNQNLALNPNKVSGGCGRLLCCLSYENDTYCALRKLLFPRDSRVRMPDGVIGKVVKTELLKQTALIETQEGTLVEMPIKDLVLLERGKAIDEGDEGEDIDELAKKVDDNEKSKVD